jgi:hypothetical protein
MVRQVDDAKVMCGVEQSGTDKSDPAAVGGQFQAGGVDLHSSESIDDLVLDQILLVSVLIRLTVVWRRCFRRVFAFSTTFFVLHQGYGW